MLNVSKEVKIPHKYKPQVGKLEADKLQRLKKENTTKIKLHDQ